jgi:hypothetical protein
MTRDEINRLIQDNELFHGTVSIGVIMDINHLERLVDLVTAAEREECAKVCDELSDKHTWEGSYADECAQAIRARGQI